MKTFVLVRVRRTGDGIGKIHQFIGLFSSRQRAIDYAQSIAVSSNMKFRVIEETIQ